MKLRTPRGFQDIMLEEAELRESVCRDVGDYFAASGYRLIETPVAERMEVLSAGFSDETSPLIDDAFRFVDVDGELLALRSDVTLPIARVVATRFDQIEGPYRLRYCTDVFREQEALRGQPRELKQLGIELLDAQGFDSDFEIIKLAVGGLDAANLCDFTLNVNNVALFLECIAAVERNSDEGDSRVWQQSVIAAAHRGDFVAVRNLCDEISMSAALKSCITTLPFLRGGKEVLEEARQLIEAAQAQRALIILDDLCALYEACRAAGFDKRITVDMSLMPDLNYYTGLVFEIYSVFGALSLGGGGRYDRMAELLGRPMPGAGFAFNVGRLVGALRAQADDIRVRDNERIKIAIPKGSLFEDSLQLLEEAGFDIALLRNAKRQLRIETDELDVIIAKPTDVAIYVANGAVDCGIGGKDILLEANYPLLELVDLRYGSCSFVVAQPKSETMTLAQRAIEQGLVRVATKYPRITAQFFDEQGIQAEIVKLNGNIELAPLIGIADVIVDITATGTTLRENNLEPLNDVMNISARFVANAASARSNPRISQLAKRLYDLTKEGSSCN